MKMINKDRLRSSKDITPTNKVLTLMELKYDDVFYHINEWWWGISIDIVKDDGTAIVCVKFDKKYFPTTGSIYGLSVLSTERRKGLGTKMIKYALMSCKDNGMIYARLYADAKNIWLRKWYERLGFKELSRDENEIEMIIELH